jgi:hypothetical protein
MKRVGVLLGALVVAFGLNVTGDVAAQEEITDAHLVAALAAVRAIGVYDEFDQALPAIADQVRNVLLQRRPDLFGQVGPVVNQVALELVPRRLDLNNDAARIWALTFTQDELVEIAAFYNSPVGQKLAEVYPTVLQETIQAFNNWSQRLAEEMLDRAVLEFQQRGIAF